MVGHLVQGLRQRRLTTFSAAINVFTFEADYLGKYPEIQLNFVLTSMTMRPTDWLSAVMSKNTRGRTIFALLLENWRMQLRNKFDIRSVREVNEGF